MLIRTGRFARADRLLRSRDFRRVLESGERQTARAFRLFLADRSSGQASGRPPAARLGITVSKRVGNAVVRNRIKRCVREWFRHARLWLPREGDIVVIARPPAAELSGSAIAAVLDRLAGCPASNGTESMAVGSR